MTSILNVASCAPLLRYNMVISVSSAPACVLFLQHASYVYARRGVTSLHAPSICPPVCADFKTLHLVYLFLCFRPLQFLRHDLGNLRNSVGSSLGI